MLFIQDKALAGRIRDVVMNKDINAKQRLLDVFDLLVQLISQRTSVLGNVHIGGSTLPNLWQELLHAALVDGIDTNNARVVLRGILAHFGEWLEETFSYFQVAEQRGKCASLIEVDYDSVPAPLINCLHFWFFTGIAIGPGPTTAPRLQNCITLGRLVRRRRRVTSASSTAATRLGRVESNKEGEVG